MEHQDVIVVGAGISGISAMVHLGQSFPQKKITMLERPGECRRHLGSVLSIQASDLTATCTPLGFSFKPWNSEKSIADGPSIMQYLNETVEEYALKEKIRFSHRVVAANWSGADALWLLTVDVNGFQKQMSCNFLFMCSGYYSYDEPHDAQIPGIESFKGDVSTPSVLAREPRSFTQASSCDWQWCHGRHYRAEHG